MPLPTSRQIPSHPSPSGCVYYDHRDHLAPSLLSSLRVVILTATCLYSQPENKQHVFGFHRARRCSKAPPPLSPDSDAKAPAAQPDQSQSCDFTRSSYTHWHSTLTPIPPGALASMRSYSVPSVLPAAATVESNDFFLIHIYFHGTPSRDHRYPFPSSI